MSMQGVSITLLAASIRGMAARGFDTQLFCRETGLDPELLQRGDARISYEEMDRLMEEASRFTGDRLFGFNQGATMEFSDLGIPGYVMQHCGTVREAVESLNRYHQMICSGYDLEVIPLSAGMTALRFRIWDPSVKVSRHCTEDMVASLYRAVSRLVGRSLVPFGLSLQHAPVVDPEVYRKVLGVMPEFSAEACELRVADEVMDWPVLARDERLLQEFKAVADRVYASMQEGRQTTLQLSRYLLDHAGAALPSLAEAARALGMSTRNLQARLKLEGTTFNRLAAELRRELALRYLSREEHSVAEVAYLLHFSEPSAFHSAFKKWTGQTPGQYRQSRGREAGRTAGGY
ncbi:AraC family transcriptional regulator [Paenibacillus herberti]|uniref:AraC family transcriptional regulator n=1 Tax=Paenibacillus herberti TaxID=1619309 RepID=A0A229NX81_9BACL|nr:AraC family transcriptional regulator [Paenibacillus herberti]OXM14344.1 AraC family transcriptional regulator [Paenibacillus herberti]